MGTRRQFFGIWLVVAAALLLVACGGRAATPTPSSAPTGTPARTPAPDEGAYLTAVKTALDGLHQRWGELRQFRGQAFAVQVTEEQRRANSQEFARRYRAYAREAREAIGGLSAPAGLESAHGALLAAVDGLVALGDELQRSLEGSPVASAEELAGVFDAAGGVTLEQRFRDACFDVQTMAATRGARVDLGCNQ